MEQRQTLRQAPRQIDISRARRRGAAQAPAAPRTQSRRAAPPPAPRPGMPPAPQRGKRRRSKGKKALVASAGVLCALCLCAGGLQLTPAENCRALCIGFAGTAARQAAAGLAAPLAVPAALCPQAVQALLALAAAEEKGTANAALCFRVLCTLNSLDQAAAVPAGPSQLVAQAVLAIHSHYSELYGVEELSAQLGVSKSHLVRVFSAEMGMGPGHYLTQVRLQAAKLLLAHRTYPLELVASLCGFSGANYFCRVFRRSTGLTPAAWRKANRGACGTPAEADALERGLFV